MRFLTTNRAMGMLSAATFVGILAAGHPASVMAEGNAKAMKPMTAHAEHATVDDVEDRIEDLHKNLKITPAQAGPWNNFAQVMTANGKNIRKILAERAKNTKTMSAADDLRSYQELAQAHVDGLGKLIPAFEALYATMSVEQKHNADTIFGETRHHAAQ